MELNAAEAKRILDDVHPEEKFILQDGTSLANLPQLKDAMVDMQAQVFNHHVNDNRHEGPHIDTVRAPVATPITVTTIMPVCAAWIGSLH